MANKSHSQVIGGKETGRGRESMKGCKGLCKIRWAREIEVSRLEVLMPSMKWEMVRMESLGSHLRLCFFIFGWPLLHGHFMIIRYLRYLEIDVSFFFFTV